MSLDKKIKMFNKWDIGLVKLSSMAFILFVIAVWPAAMELVHSISWGWFLAACVVFAIIPFKKAYL